MDGELSDSEAELTIANPAFREFVGQLTAGMDIIREAVDAALEFEKSFVETIRSSLESISQIDWAATAKNFDAYTQMRFETARAIASKGWTIPHWITPSQFENLRDLEEALIDEFFIMAYSENDFTRLKALIDRLSQEPEMATWKLLIEEIGDSITSGRYRVAIPAILTILEGYAVRIIIRPNNLKNTNLATLFNGVDFHRQPGIQALPWVSNLTFMQNLFATSDFAQAPPNLLNRHWVLHGRSEVDWVLADALRLLTALDTMSWARA